MKIPWIETRRTKKRWDYKMDMIKELSDAFLILIRAGTVMRVVYSFIMISSNEDEEKSYKKKIRNVMIFYVLAELAYVIQDLMFDYYM